MQTGPPSPPPSPAIERGERNGAGARAVPCSTLSVKRVNENPVVLSCDLIAYPRVFFGETHEA